MERPVRVLIVDDDDAIRLLCRINLELDGYAVDEAGSAADFRAALARAQPNVVLLDVHIGATSGLELLAELRQQAPGASAALLTGSADTAALRDSGADALIAKPFTIDELRETVARLHSIPR